MTVSLVKEGIGVGWTLKNCIQNDCQRFWAFLKI